MKNIEKILIIGGGAIADCTHIPVSVEFFGADNVYLAEPNGMQAEKLVRKHQLIHVVSDYRDALDDVDACIICTPPHVRNVILKDCIAAGKHVLCEKPLSPSSAESRAILSSAPDDLVIGMCHTYRFFNNRKEVRRMLLDGFFGDAPSITVNEGSPSGWPTVSGYCFRKEMVPGGVMYDNGIHSLDFVLWCLGMPDSVKYEDDAMGGLESNAVMSFGYGNAVAFLKFSRTMELSNTITVEGGGHKAVMEVFEHNRYILDGVQAVAAGEPVNWGNITRLQMKNFLDAVEGKCPVSCSAEEGAMVIELLEKCYSKRKQTEYERHPVGGLKGKKIFITGGTGFIGSHIVEQLVLHEEAEVRVLVHTWAKAAYVSRFDVEFVQADLLDREQMIEAAKGCDYIIHAALAGGAEHDQSVADNVAATENVMAAARANKVRSMVQFSSVVVHGATVPDDLTADSPLVSYGDTYADGKLESEKRFRQLLEQYGLHGSIIRPTYVWGPYSMWYTLYPLEQMRKGEFAWVDRGKGICNAVYVGNVVDLCLTCLTDVRADKEAFIACDENSGTWADLYGSYVRLLNRKPEDYPSVPLRDGCWRTFRLKWRQHLLDVNGWLCKRIEIKEKSSPLVAKLLYRMPRRVLRNLRKIVTVNLPVVPASVFAIYSQKSHIDTRKNRQVLGFSPRHSLEEGLKTTIEWLKFSDLYD